MDFVELTKRSNRDLHDACDRTVLQQTGRALDRAGGLKKLLISGDKCLAPFTGEQLAMLAQVHRDAILWKESARELRRVLSTSGVTLPDGSLQKAAEPHELAALGRAARMSPRSAHQDHNGWARAVEAHVDLWRACVSIGMTSGTVAITMVAPDHADAEEFVGHVTAKSTFAELKSYRWLGARRGERAGILSINITLPMDELLQQAEARLPAMGLGSQKRGAQSVLNELVLDNLQGVLGALMDARARAESLRSAASAYWGLLTSPPLKESPVLAIHIGSNTAPAGVVLLDENGDLIASEEIPAGNDLVGSLAGLVAEHNPATAVLPVSSTDTGRLEKATEALGSITLIRVLPTALREARKDLPFSPVVASAVVLGRRAIDPATEFAKVPPAALGLGEYSSDLDHDQLTEILEETRLIVSWERSQGPEGARPRKKGPAAARPGKAIKRLNPMVKTIRDLKPGMTLDGVITNLTRFGAFVNVGLSTEAMIHVSQLSTEFVEEPSEVVRVGQNVSARVIEVVPEKSRIALSLKPAPEPGDRPQFREGRSDMGGGRGGPPSSARRAHSPMDSSGSHRGRGDGEGDKKSRTAALADLDALFKK